MPSNWQPYGTYSEWLVKFRSKQMTKTIDFLRTAVRIKKCLQHHHRTNPGKKFISDYIGGRMGLNPAQVREFMAYLRNTGLPICSTSKGKEKGYWWDQQPEAVYQTLCHLEERRHAIKHAMNRLERYLPKNYWRTRTASAPQPRAFVPTTFTPVIPMTSVTPPPPSQGSTTAIP